MRCAIALIGLLSLAFAPAPLPRVAKPTPASADLAAMQGRWDRIAYTVGQTKVQPGAGNIRIVGQKVAFFLGDRLRDEWSISLRPEKDTNRFEAKIISGDGKGRTISGTYRQHRDVLTLSYQITIHQGLLADPEHILIVLTYKRKQP